MNPVLIIFIVLNWLALSSILASRASDRAHNESWFMFIVMLVVTIICLPTMLITDFLVTIEK